MGQLYNQLLRAWSRTTDSVARLSKCRSASGSLSGGSSWSSECLYSNPQISIEQLDTCKLWEKVSFFGTPRALESIRVYLTGGFPLCGPHGTNGNLAFWCSTMATPVFATFGIPTEPPQRWEKNPCCIHGQPVPLFHSQLGSLLAKPFTSEPRSWKKHETKCLKKMNGFSKETYYQNLLLSSIAFKGSLLSDRNFKW